MKQVDLLNKLDQKLGNFTMRLFAVLAFIGFLASTGFGAIVVATALFPGVLSILSGVFFIWIGIRSWGDHGKFGGIS